MRLAIGNRATRATSLCLERHFARSGFGASGTCAGATPRILSGISLAILLVLGCSAEVQAQAIINPGPELTTYGVIQPLARQMGMASLGTLNERVGNTLSPSIGLEGTAGWWTPPSGWARVMGEHLDNHYLASTDPEVTGDLLGAQVGVDVWRDRQPSGQGDAVGVYFAYTHSRGDVSSLLTSPSGIAYENEPTGTTRLDGYGGGAYWTHLGAGGWYTDAVLQGTHYSGHASTAHAYLPISGEGYVASLEAGYPFAFELGAPFILEPQAQFVWQHTSFGSKNDGLTDVDLGSSSGVSGRLGVRGQWTIAEEGGSVYQPFLRTNVWRDWSGEVTTTYGGIVQVPLQQQITRIDVAAGLTATIDPRRHFGFYIQIGTRFTLTDSDHRRQDGVWGSGGVRLAW